MPVKKLSDLPQKTASDNGDGFVITSVTGQDMRVPFQNLRENLGVNVIENSIQTLEDGQTRGFIGYTDKATMDADTTQDSGTVALVTNDATASNNGYYRWDGSAWVKRDEFYATSLDPEGTSEAVTGKAVNDFTDEQIGLKSLKNRIKDPSFSTYSDVAVSGAEWVDLNSGNDISAAGGVITVNQVIDSNVNISQSISDEPISRDDDYAFYVELFMPSGFTASNIFINLISLYSGGNYEITSRDGNDLGLVAGWNEILIEGRISDNDPGTNIIETLRVDLRLKQDGSKARFPRLLFSRDANFLGKFVKNFSIKDNERSKIDKILFEDVYTNLGVQDTANYFPVVNATKSNSGSDVQIIGGVAVGESDKAIYFDFNTESPWNPNHKYYIAFDLTVNVIDNSVDGNFNPRIDARADDSTALSSYGNNRKTVVMPDRGILKVELDLNASNSYAEADRLRVNFAQDQFTEGEDVDIIFHNVLIVDCGEIGNLDYTWNDIDTYYSEYGIQQSLSVLTSPLKNTSSSTSAASLADIEGWGDSLMAQDWLQYVNEETGRNTFVNGFGGEESHYIRDQFLANVQTSRTQIICVGRNNFNETTYVIDDIRAMIDALPHNRFIIMGVITGSQLGELEGGGAHGNIVELNRKLSEAFPNNFVDQRKGIIQLYDFGGITLDAPFTQPSIGSNVQINVSDADFLTNENSVDATQYPNEAGHIRIGRVTGTNGAENTDLYEVVSKDSSLLLTVKLIESNLFTPGETVDNPIKNGSVKYLKVVQNLDYYTYQNDTTPSTTRQDSGHATTAGLKLKAKIIARALLSKGF